jgi:hypothetical protein
MAIVKKFRDNFRSPEEVLLFIRIFLLITVLPLLIRFLTLPQLMKVLAWRISTLSGKHNDEYYKDKIVRFSDYILTRDFWIYKSTCLKRSLVLFHFLRRAIPDIYICFGVRLRNDVAFEKQKVLDGHAWLMNNEGILLERNPDVGRMYTVTYCFPEMLSSAKDLRDF